MNSNKIQKCLFTSTPYYFQVISTIQLSNANYTSTNINSEKYKSFESLHMYDKVKIKHYYQKIGKYFCVSIVNLGILHTSR